MRRSIRLHRPASQQQTQHNAQHQLFLPCQAIHALEYSKSRRNHNGLATPPFLDAGYDYTAGASDGVMWFDDVLRSPFALDNRGRIWAKSSAQEECLWIDTLELG
jgi:hypothetical protein